MFIWQKKNYACIVTALIMNAGNPQDRKSHHINILEA